MVDHRIFDKAKDMDSLRLLYVASMQKASSELEVKIIEAAVKKAIRRLKESEE